MKIKIVKVSERSAHFKAPYTLIGTIGDVEKMGEMNGATFFELTNCVYPPQDGEAENLDNGSRTTVLVDEYEVVE